jgi:predicted lysophospholipase L1 biosynthesis ABC-type transport system permease subunit
MSGSPKKQLVECVVGGVLGTAIGVVSISLLHGAITQLEKPENIFPGWTANRALAVFCVNISVFAMILMQAGRHGPTALPNNVKTEES